MHTHELRAHLRALLEPTVARLGFDLVAVEIVVGRRRTVRLSIDAPGGVGADDCARVSHRVSPLLDEDDPIEGAYDLEVSSPGIDRPVQRWDDVRRFVGYRARLRLEEGLSRRRFTGTIVRAHDGVVDLEVDGTVHVIDFDTIESAHLVLDLEAYARLAEGLPPVPDAPDAADPDAGATTAPAPGTEEGP